MEQKLQDIYLLIKSPFHSMSIFQISIFQFLMISLDISRPTYFRYLEQPSSNALDAFPLVPFPMQQSLKKKKAQNFI